MERQFAKGPDQAPPDPAARMLSKEKGEKGTGVFCWENWDPAGMARQGVDHTDKSLIFNAKGIVVGKERAAKLLGAL